MKERPILFSGEMVKAILGGRKTVTRRVVKPRLSPVATFADYKTDLGYPASRGDFWAGFYLNGKDSDSPGYFKCPYGIPGDRLWVRETLFAPPKPRKDCLGYVADGDIPHGQSYRIVPSIFMPRLASRITLEITNVKAERLQEIGAEDCISEGIDYDNLPETMSHDPGDFAILRFHHLWDFLNGKKYPWSSNPWVWVIKFKKVQP